VTPLLSAWLAEVILITYRGAANKAFTNNPVPGLALPSEYVSTFIIYGALAFVPGEGQKVATAFGWGLVVATFLNLWNPGGSVKQAATVESNAATGANVPISSQTTTAPQTTTATKGS